MYGLFATQTMAWVAISIACLYYPPPAAASFILATITAYKKKKLKTITLDIKAKLFAVNVCLSSRHFPTQKGTDGER